MAITRGLLIELCKPLATIALVAVATGSIAAQTTTQQLGPTTITTEQMSGEVVKVEGNDLIVRMSNGELRTFSDVPDSRRASIDGKDVGVRDLQPGTRLTATINRSMTPVTTRTTTVLTGTVAYVAGTTVIVRLPNDEVKQYTVRPDFEFVVNGRPATVNDLRAGMAVSAQKIVEETSVSFASDTKVIGQAPAARAGASASAAPGAGGQAATSGATAGAARGGQTMASTSGAGGGSQSAAGAAQLPKTASDVSLLGLAGLFLVGSAIVVRRIRRA